LAEVLLVAHCQSSEQQWLVVVPAHFAEQRWEVLRWKERSAFEVVLVEGDVEM
jgi:hypothetical protein